MSFSITPSAEKKISTLIAESPQSHNSFRIEVRGGGCQGFEYHFEISDKMLEDDETFQFNNAVIKIDRTSLLYLMGSELDWKTTLTEEKFEMSNPNASSSCGCGTSFSI
jgi:iron-sulfur cluster insertion protein